MPDRVTMPPLSEELVLDTLEDKDASELTDDDARLEDCELLTLDSELCVDDELKLCVELCTTLETELPPEPPPHPNKDNSAVVAKVLPHPTDRRNCNIKNSPGSPRPSVSFGSKHNRAHLI